MKILEVKNNLVKISYTAQDNLILSGFVIIEDSQCPYVAQVMSLKADSGSNYAIVKLLFTFNEEGIVKNYNGTIPELDANITRLSSNELLDILPVEQPLKIGKLAQQNFLLNVDYSILEKNLLICSDKTEYTDILLSNFAKQITEYGQKSVIFDTDATINAENTLVFGRDFKLPLNYDTINFIYENDLTDVEPTSKAVIQDIFLEVQEYSKTVLDNFIPFDNFIAVVETQYRETGIPELALLKNRLLKYKEEAVFAQNVKEIHALRSAIRANMSTLIDISRADDVLQKQIINYVYDEINSMDLFVNSLVKINSANADKKLIRKFLSQDKIYTTVAAPHNYKYVYELKDRASNMIFLAPQTLQHDFNSYNVFLNKLNDDECIVFGKATQNIPLIVEIMPLEELEEEFANMPAEKEEAVTPQPEPEQEPVKDDFSEESDSYSYETMLEDNIPLPEEPLEELDETAPEPLVNIFEEMPKELPPLELMDYDNSDDSEDSEQETVANKIPVDIDADDEEILETSQIEEEFEGSPNKHLELEEVEDDEVEEDAPVEAEEEVISEDEIDTFDENFIQETDETESLEEPLEDKIEEDDNNYPAEETVQEEEIVEEQPEEISEEEPLVEDSEETLPSLEDELPAAEPELPILEETQQDNLTEDDLDFIQDINMPEESKQPNLEDQLDDKLEDRLPDENPPVIPIYPAEEPTANSNAVVFEPGDRVRHPKYGEGVVEKMIKYGNKVLCSISFENGRRLLDPTISEVQKV